jgi:DmsE family decaheme c-type cytochrome
MNSKPLGRKASDRRDRGAIMAWLNSVLRITAVLFGIISAPSNASLLRQPYSTVLAQQSAPNGPSSCATCHGQIVQNFTSNPHAKIAPASGPDNAQCVSCHGSGKAHIESGGDKGKIFSFGGASSEEVSRRCVTCHSKASNEFTHSVHGTAKLSCISCHSAHATATGKNLVKEAQPALCLQCHSGVTTSFSMLSHHPAAEGQIKCTDCHDPHVVDTGKSTDSARASAICTRCHTNQAGPFVFEHRVISVEGCVACHNPHGSEHAKLLSRADINSMCQLCHSVTGSISHAQKMLPRGHADGRTAQKACCIDCHTHFHGSNADKDFLK